MKKIVIDAGHGGYDPGAQGYGLKEKDINLDFALRVKALLAPYSDSLCVVLTRDDDSTPGGIPDQNSTLAARCECANACGADYFLSIHANAAGGEGFESFIFEGCTDDATHALQAAIHGPLAAFYEGHGCDDRGMKEANFYVLRNTDMPALLIENLFIDNAHDAGLLTNGDVLDGAAQGIADGLLALCGIVPILPEEPPASLPLDAVEWQRELAEAKAWAKGAGIVQDDFDDGDMITKGQFVVVMHRMMETGYIGQ